MRTEDLTGAADFDDDFSVGFSVLLRYSDGTERLLTAAGSARRTAAMVATAALADSAETFPDSVRDYLQRMLT